ncbi:MAG: hypothetical protein WCG01_02560 [bacterium]
MLVAEAIEKFKNLPEVVLFAATADQYTEVLDRIKSRYDLVLNSVVILVIVGELAEDKVKNYLISTYELDEATAENITKDLQDNYFSPLRDRLFLLNGKPLANKTATIWHVRILLEIFEGKILDEINAPRAICEALNFRIFSILPLDENFSHELERALSNNQEMIGKKLVIDGRPVPPVIANWLKDFVKTIGAVMFDQLQLTQYLINSPNVKLLTEQERKVLSRVLKTYRNIKYFPASMPNDKGDGWEIIPVERQIESVIVQDSTDVFADLNAPNSSIDDNQARSQVVQANVSEGLELKGNTAADKAQSVVNEKRLAELLALSATYAEGSLERRAVDEEIKRNS